jgi:hypothetical protein
MMVLQMTEMIYNFEVDDGYTGFLEGKIATLLALMGQAHEQG